MVRTRCAAIAAAALIATVAVTACGSAGVSVTGGTPSGAITNPSEVRGGTLRFANSGDWDSLDPADTYFTDAWDFARLYGRSLVMFKPAPPGIAIFCPLACFCQPQEVLAGAAPPSWLAPDLLRVALA